MLIGHVLYSSLSVSVGIVGWRSISKLDECQERKTNLPVGGAITYI